MSLIRSGVLKSIFADVFFLLRRLCEDFDWLPMRVLAAEFCQVLVEEPSFPGRRRGCLLQAVLGIWADVGGSLGWEPVGRSAISHMTGYCVPLDSKRFKFL